MNDLADFQKVCLMKELFLLAMYERVDAATLSYRAHNVQAPCTDVLRHVFKVLRCEKACCITKIIQCVCY
jgi:hypothetical protein